MASLKALNNAIREEALLGDAWIVLFSTGMITQSPLARHVVTIVLLFHKEAVLQDG